MDVMLDTNVLLSAALFPGGTINKLFDNLISDHNIIVSSYSLSELARVVRRKFPNKIRDVEAFLIKFPFELIHTPEVDIVDNNFDLRDPADYPILLSAIVADVDVLITGDKDFADVSIPRPQIMTPAEFSQKY